MTDVATQVCPSCNAQVSDTKFCENCGFELKAAAPAQVNSPTSGYYSPPLFAVPVTPVRHAATVFRVFALLLLLFGNFLPAIFMIGNPLGYLTGFAGGPFFAIELGGGLLIALFMLLAAATGSAGDGGKALGIIFALAFAGITLVEAFAHQAMEWQNSTTVMNALAASAMFLSWAAGRPFRGPGYFGLLVFILFEVLNYYSDYGIETSVFGVGAGVLVGLVASAFVLSLVGLVILFERRRMTAFL